MDLHTFALTLRNKHRLQIIAGFDCSPGPEKSPGANLHLQFPNEKNFDQIADHCHHTFTTSSQKPKSSETHFAWTSTQSTAPMLPATYAEAVKDHANQAITTYQNNYGRRLGFSNKPRSTSPDDRL